MKRSITGIIFLAFLVILPLTWLTTAIVAKMRKKKTGEPEAIEPETIESKLIDDTVTPEIVEKKVNAIIDNMETDNSIPFTEIPNEKPKEPEIIDLEAEKEANSQANEI